MTTTLGPLTSAHAERRPVPLPSAASVGGFGAEATEGFRELYQREFSNIAGYCFLLVRDEEMARDLAQEAFTRLFGRWRHVREPRPFLFRVATNLVRDQWSARKRERDLTEVLKDVHDASTPPADSSTRDAVLRLPRPQRDVVLLYYYADLPVPEVAAALRRPVGTVKRLLSEARAQLAVSLEDPHA